MWFEKRHGWKCKQCLGKINAITKRYGKHWQIKKTLSDSCTGLQGKLYMITRRDMLIKVYKNTFRLSTNTLVTHVLFKIQQRDLSNDL